jgi:ABC-type lipoprotein release transport system permease subunit
MALGAQIGHVLRLVIWHGMKLVVLGVVAGAAGGYALKRLVTSQYVTLEDWQRNIGEQLYGVTATDPWTFGLVAGLLILVALIACYIPARRATKVDPLVALRYE